MRRSSTLSRVLACLLCLLIQPSIAQELEPRRWTHLPVGANFVGMGYALSDGNIFLDPSLLIEDAQAKLHSFGLGYVRALDVAGKSGRIQFTAPYSLGRWEGLVDGELASTRRAGFGDPRVRFAVNLVGSPAQRAAEFAQFQPKTIVGVALDVSLPLGEYRSDRLINLGSNRWTLRPQIGVVHNFAKWTVELTGSAWLFTDNQDYFQGTEREQDPLYALETHAIYTFRPGLWASLSAAYGSGARSILDGIEGNDRQGNLLWAASMGFPIDRRHGFKVAFVKGDTTRSIGVDYDSLIFAYSYMWGEGL